MLSPSLMIVMTGTMMAMAMAAMSPVMGFTIPQPLVPRPLQPFRSGSTPSVSSSPFLAQLRRGQCQHHHDGLHQRWHPGFRMAAPSTNEAGSTGGDALLNVTSYDSVFKTFDFWTIKDDGDVIKMLKTLPKPGESVIKDAINKMNVTGSDEDKMSAWELEWLDRMMTFRKKIIEMVKTDGDKEGDIRSYSNAYAELQKDHLLAQWLYNDGNEGNALFAWESIKGLGGLDNPKVDLRQSVLESLERLFTAVRKRTKHSLRRMKCGTATAVAYYIGKCKFRHMGDEYGIPRRVHLTQYKEPAASSIVRVFFSGSGTGKTVDLATSAESRDAVITLMYVAKNDVATAEASEARTNQSRGFLKKCMDDDFFENNGEVLSTIANTVQQRLRTLDSIQATNDAQGAATDADSDDDSDDDAQGNGHPKVKDDRIRIVFAIDEARYCPNLAKEVIRNYEDLGRDLGHYIMNKAIGNVKNGNSTDDGGLPRDTSKPPIEVVFSIAGTGMYGGAVGSLSDNFVCLEPSAKKDPKEVYETLCNEYDGDLQKQSRLPTYDKIMETPFLSIIASHNARMASILVNQLTETLLKFGELGDEMRLMSLVFDKFARSNGLAGLWDDRDFEEKGSDRSLRAAQALAILLYQTNFTVPMDIERARQHAMDLDYGINFEDFGMDNKEIMYFLVTRFGLVTPEPFTIFDNIVLDANNNTVINETFKGQPTLEKPFIVDEAIQLFCVWLLERGKSLNGEDGFLGTTPFAYEALSTQIIGAAITAATTVSLDNRTCIQSIVEDTLGMKLKLSTGDSGGETDYVGENWEALKDVIPVSSWSDLAMDGMYHQISQMSVYEPTGPKKPEGFGSKTTKEANQWLQKEWKRLRKALEARIVLKRWDELKTKQVNSNSGKDPRQLISAWDNAESFNAITWETLVPTLDIDKKLADELLKMRKACVDLEKVIRDIEAPQFNPTNQKFCPSLTTVAQGSSNLADGYVSTVGARKITDNAGNFSRWEVELFTACVQAKDYFDSTPIGIEDIRDNRDKIHNSLVDIIFGFNRLYCVASRQDKLRLDIPYSGNKVNGTSLYAGFPTDKSPLLTKSMDKLDERRRQSQKTDKNAYRITTRQDMNVVRNIVSWMRDSLDKINTQSRRGKENNENAGEMDQFEDEDAADDEEHDVEPDGNATRRDD